MSEFARKLFDNAMLTLISRLAIIAASALFPVVGFLGAFAINRAVTSFDDLGKKIDQTHEQEADTNSTLKLVQAEQAAQGAMLSDHELRVRHLEGQARRTIP